MKKGLLRHSRNVRSENGEDGIIAELLDRFGIETGGCVEFGAWDGEHLSNTYALVERGWHAVYIEGDPDRFQDLLATVGEHPKIRLLQAFVASEGENALDNLPPGRRSH
jgi:hypothetical protein